MMKFFKIPRMRGSSDTADSASIATAGSDSRENKMGTFHRAALHGDLNKLEQLVQIVGINHVDKENRTALHIACSLGNVELVKYLVKRNIKIDLCDKHHKSALLMAVEAQHEPCVNILLEHKANLNLADLKGNTPLHIASWIPSISTAISLVKHNADINAKNLEGISPLTMAVEKDHINVAEFLLKKGADVNILDRRRRSPLMIAAGKGRLQMVRILLKFGANTNLTDCRGQSAMDYADMECRDRCKKAIGDHIKKQSSSILLLPCSTKKRSKSLERSASKDAVCFDRAGTPGGRREDPKRKESEISQLLKLFSPFDEGIDSDCDKASYDSKRIRPEGSVTSQKSEEFPDCSASSMEVRGVETQLKISRTISDKLQMSPGLRRSHTKKLLPDSDSSPAISPRSIKCQLDSDKPASRQQKGRNTEWSFQVAKEDGRVISVKNLCEIERRVSEGHASVKTESSLSRKGSSLRSKEMMNHSETCLLSKKHGTPSARKMLGERSVSHQRLSVVNKPDEPTVEEFSMLAVVSTTHPSGNVPNSKDPTGNDESSLSDVSEEEGRWQAKQKPKKQRIDEIEVSEELDEITSSSDLTFEDCELHCSTHQERPFKIKMEDMPQHKLPILRPKDHHACAVKMSKLKSEKADLRSKMEEVKDGQCVMEHKHMQMETEITNLRLSSKQQQEDCINTIRMAHLNNEKLEQELRQAHVQLSQERCANAQLQQKLKSQDCKQQTIEEDYKRAKNNEDLLRSELQATQTHTSNKQRDLVEENERLKEQLEDIHQDFKLANDNQHQSVVEWNNVITGLKCEVTLLNARLEAQCQAHSVLEAEAQSVRNRLAEADQLRSETDKALLQEKEEQQRLKDKFAGEMASQREVVAKLAQKLAKAKAHGNTMENELHTVKVMLSDKNAQIATLNREMEQINVRIKELEAALQTEKDLVSWAGARQEATQDLLGQSQSENVLLRQKLEEIQKQCVAKELAVADAQKCFSEILAKLRSDCEDRVQLVQDRNQDLAAKAHELREHMHLLQEEKNEREASLRQLRAQLADSMKRLSKCEASLELHIRYRSEAEEEKIRLHKEIDRVKKKMDEKECHYILVEKQASELKTRLDEREQQLCISTQKHKEALSLVAAGNNAVKLLEESVQRHRSLLKAAKRKLRDHIASEIEREKVNELQAELKRQLSFRGLLEKNKKHLEEEVQTLRRKVETNTVENRHVEHYRHEIEEKARQEIQKKIHEVNLFLQSQAATQEAQDQIKATTEVSLRSKIQELEGELKRARSIQNDAITQRDALHKELKRYRQMHRDEQWLRKSLSNELKRSNSRLTEANARLLSERCKSIVSSGPPCTTGTPCTPGPLASTSGTATAPAPYRMRNSRILSPVAEGHSSNVEEYLCKKSKEKSKNCTPHTDYLADHRKHSWK
ncbi:ankyrin repeat domain-containing protein 26-like [Corythoichthys intestinalis]|uniref:ankyrin repeat domain-containing protein 26-like n=1 Tax=Corythoichthys intestinalis TaxID=161448 RepID=UPI0025A51B5B|nr:ankyrin repeat domain-containing protein 26-like [Corythoichthys intestinalis]XP_057693321.1 ankyrin repeat domain-containing protein 26-like [Corythoichthys intestinalis]